MIDVAAPRMPRVIARVPSSVVGAAAGVLLGLLAAALPRAGLGEAARAALLLAPFVAAAVVDLRTRRIPNALSAAALAGALTEAAASGRGLDAGAAALAGLAIGVALMLLARGGFGMGDVKLLAGGGAAAGLGGLASFVFAMSLAGGIAAGAVLLARRERGATMPYGPAIVAGLALTLLLLDR